jgi:hypothetical protein
MDIEEQYSQCPSWCTFGPPEGEFRLNNDQYFEHLDELEIVEYHEVDHNRIDENIEVRVVEQIDFDGSAFMTRPLAVKLDFCDLTFTATNARKFSVALTKIAHEVEVEELTNRREASE